MMQRPQRGSSRGAQARSPEPRGEAPASARRRAASANRSWGRAPPFAFHHFSTPEAANNASRRSASAISGLIQLYSAAEFGEPDPISSEVFANFMQVEFSQDERTEGVECGICLAEFERGELLRQLPCGHRYHEPCLRQWFKRQPTCPTCRFDCRPGVRRGFSRFSASPGAQQSSQPMVRRRSHLPHPSVPRRHRESN
mmetsp:Transcript_144888/g.255396  ORF Transcript_144888/g.255396 Transcript_144888/m.255396 type:complete len:198 (+) Transcript_144888:95-688(+)